jgi:hypothetical protein
VVGCRHPGASGQFDTLQAGPALLYLFPRGGPRCVDRALRHVATCAAPRPLATDCFGAETAAAQRCWQQTAQVCTRSCWRLQSALFDCLQGIVSYKVLLLCLWRDQLGAQLAVSQACSGQQSSLSMLYPCSMSAISAQVKALGPVTVHSSVHVMQGTGFRWITKALP